LSCSSSQEKQLKRLLDNNEDIFGELNASDKNKMVCEIRLLPQHAKTAMTFRGYQIPADEERKLEDQVASQLEKKIIEEVPGDEHPQVLAPAFLLPKPNGERRMVVDYSRVNKVLQPTSLQLP
jgi:hypothetical protein